MCPSTGCFSKVWYLVTYERQATYRITADCEEASRWSEGFTLARRQSYKLYKEAHDNGELHHSYIMEDMPIMFMLHPNFIMTN